MNAVSGPASLTAGLFIYLSVFVPQLVLPGIVLHLNGYYYYQFRIGAGSEIGGHDP